MTQSETDAKTDWHPEAELEAIGASEWYASRSNSAADRFITQLNSTIERIAATPKQFSFIGHKARRALLSDFPYAVIFCETPTKIQIIAIAHGKRRPQYWRNRKF